MASGLCAALTGRTHGCTDQPANVKKTLANSEPSTHGTKRTWPPRQSMSAYWGKADSQRTFPERPVLTAGSTGRRNTGVKFLCRGFKSQGLAWPLIELAGHFVEMGLRVHRQVGSFRKILSQQAIGVLVGTALPWTLRIAKVNIDVGR